MPVRGSLRPQAKELTYFKEIHSISAKLRIERPGRRRNGLRRKLDRSDLEVQLPSPSTFALKRPRERRLVREIAILTVIKVLVLIALSQLFFSAARHPPATADDVSKHLFVDPVH